MQEDHVAQLRAPDDKNIPSSHCPADEERMRRKREQGAVLAAHFHALSQLKQTVGCIERRLTRPTVQFLSRNLSLAEQLLTEARDALEQEDFEALSPLLTRAQTSLSDIQNTVDHILQRLEFEMPQLFSASRRLKKQLRQEFTGLSHD
jgi:DNA repair ATPase RecN